MTTEKMFDRIDALTGQAVRDRRDFHQFAETGWLEFRTSAKIAERLRTLGIPFQMGTAVVNPEFVMGRPGEQEVEAAMERATRQGADPKLVEMTEGYTGVVATLRTGRPGPVVALRFDIDANDLNEASDMEHRPFAEGFSSRNPGAQHACGHDAHAAIGLLTAEVLSEMLPTLCGTIKLFFQPAEEGVRGALSMVKTGAFQDVDYFLCGHVSAAKRKERMLVASAFGMLATTKLDVTFTGKSAHAGGAPELGRNALLAASSATLGLYSLCQDGRGATRLNVGVLNAGIGRNAVADRAFMKIETRGDTTQINDELCEKARRVINAAADMYGVSVEIQSAGGAQSGKGDDDLAEIICRVAERYDLADEILSSWKMGGSEDATYMMAAVQARGGKACYMRWGSDIRTPAHNDRFDLSEETIPAAAKITCAVVKELLGNPANG